MEGMICALATALGHYESRHYLKKQGAEYQEKNLKTIWSEIYNEVRDAAGSEKITEKTIESKILAHPTYKGALDSVAEAHETVARMVEAFNFTKAALEKARNVREDAIQFLGGQTGFSERRTMRAERSEEDETETEGAARFRAAARRKGE
jgi:hypothetical protein